MDFKENITLGGEFGHTQNEYYTKTFRSVLGIIVYYKYNDVVCKRAFDFVSEILNHDALFATLCLRKLYEDEWFASKKFSSIKIWTDCGPHFRCKEFLYFLYHDTCARFKEVEWNLFEVHHGKTEVDGHFGQLARWLRDANKATLILTTTELFQAWESRAQDYIYPVTFIELSKEEYQRGTIHQVDIPSFQNYLGFRFKNTALYGVAHFNASRKRLYGRIVRKKDDRQTKVAWEVDSNKKRSKRRQNKSTSSASRTRKSSQNATSQSATSQPVESNSVPIDDPMEVEDSLPMNRTSEPLVPVLHAEYDTQYMC